MCESSWISHLRGNFLYTSALCYNPVKKRVMVTPASAEKVQLCRNSGSQHLV